MSWDDTMGNFEDGSGEVPIRTIMVCDYCQKELEWYNASRDYDNPDEELIQIAKDTDGWVIIATNKYENDPEDPAMIEIHAKTFHACPECRRTILKIGDDRL